MAFSVNTNVGAMAALQSLNATSKDLATTQSRINTGLKVASTKDDSASYTIAQTLRGDLGGLGAVTSSLSRAKSTIDVAVAGSEQISDLLNQMGSKVLEASDTGLDADSKTAIASDIEALQSQIKSIVKSSDFNGTNLLDASGGSISALKTAKPTAGGAVAGEDTIEVATQDIATVLDVTLTAAGSAVTVDDVEAAKTGMKTVLSTLGSKAREIDSQLTFTSKLSDVIEGGIGNLVDADLAKESAKLQALQVKQQLGVQALSIANQAPQAIMSLFR